MNKTDEILEKLRHVQQPEIDLTDQIMGSLGPASSSVREGRSINFLPIVRAVLSVAAVWIVGFFLYLQYDVAAPTAKAHLVALEQGRGGATLREVYKSRLCQDCKKSISYTQFKTMLYENK